METFLIALLLIILLLIGFVLIAMGITYYVFKSVNSDISSYFNDDQEDIY